METNTEPVATAPAPEQSVEQMLQTLLQKQQEDRAEMATLRQEVAASRKPAPVVTANAPSPAEALEARMADVNEHSHYCPGCGKLSTYIRDCLGNPASPHPPVQMVSTDELKGDDVSKHTAAPDTTNLG